MTDTTIDTLIERLGERGVDPFVDGKGAVDVMNEAAEALRTLTAENTGLGESLDRRNIDYQKACLGKGELLDRINLQENEIERLRKLLLAATEEGS